MVSATFVVCVVPLAAPVTVIEYGPPAAVPEATVIVIVHDPLPRIAPGQKPTVTPAGCPLAVTVGGTSKGPLVMVYLIVEVPLLPGATERDVGVAERVKV